MWTATTSPRPTPWSASQPATACARGPSAVKVSGRSWSMNAVRSPHRRTAARRIDPTGTCGYSSDRGSPGGQLAAVVVGASVAVMRIHFVGVGVVAVCNAAWLSSHAVSRPDRVSVKMRHMSDQRTALVLGGGGITGIAWEIGVLAGLAEAGTDLSGAELVVGTSAGSVVGAQLACGAELEAMYQRQLEPATAEKAARLNRATLAQFGWAQVGRPGQGRGLRPAAAGAGA